jgi:tetratricopeptide (TPR) repeat protein
VDRVVGLIVNNKASRVAIVGPGGMGKTSIALTVLHDKRVIDHFPAHRHFIPCDQAPTPELLVSLLSRSLQLQVTKGNQLEQVLILLRSYTQPSLLILDNLETPWDCVASQNEIEENFQQLDAIPTLTIIITMRDRLLPGGIRWTPLDPVDRLSKEAAGKTFMDIYDGVIDDQLDNLLLALDYIPLAIILVATIGRVSRMSPSLLLEGWEKERTTLLTVSNHRLKSVDVSIRLSLESSPVRLNPDAVELLSVAAMLPNGVPRGRLYNLAPAIHAVDAAARVLLRVSLAQLSPNDTLQILSPVRSYILQHYPLAMGSRQHLYKVYFELAREGNCQPGDDKFVRASHNLTEEGSNMEAVITDALQHDCSEAAVWAAYNYSRYLFWNQPRAELLKRSLNSAQELPSKEAWRLCLQLLGNMYRKQNQFELADNTLQKAYTAFVEHGYPVGAAWCLWSRGETYLYRSLHKKAFNFFLDAHDMFNQLGAEVGCAYCKHSMGIIYNRLGRHTEALSNYEMARDALRRFGDFHGSAWTLCGIGEVYSDQMRYTEARELFTEGRRIFIEYGDRLGQNWCLYGLADIHDNPEGTQAMLDQAGAVFKEFGNRGGAAWCLFSSGNLRKSRDDYEGAHSKFEEARRIFADELGDQFGVAWCLREVGDTFRLCGDYQKATCKFREARDAFKQLPNDLLAAECQKFVDEIEAK